MMNKSFSITSSSFLNHQTNISTWKGKRKLLYIFQEVNKKMKTKPTKSKTVTIRPNGSISNTRKTVNTTKDTTKDTTKESLIEVPWTKEIPERLQLPMHNYSYDRDLHFAFIHEIFIERERPFEVNEIRSLIDSS
jgi:hypothetical protein